MSEPGSLRISRPMLLTAAILLAAAPFGVAVIRVLRTGNDVRYFWVALAAFVGAGLAMSIGRARADAGVTLFRLSLLTFAVSTIAAVSAARLLGARAVFGIWAVAIVFALFFTASQALYTISRTSRSSSGLRS